MNLNTVDTVPRRFDPVTATPAVDPVHEEGRTRRRHAAEDDDHQRRQQLSGNERNEREFKQQRHALVEGVVTAFFPQGSGVPATTEAGGTASATGSDGATQAVSDNHPADQNLEKAIMRFVHAVFDTLRDYESAKAEAGSGGSTAVSGASHHSGSKTPLSDGLSAMARDYAAAGQAGAAAAPASQAASASSAAGASGAPASGSATATANPASSGAKAGIALPEKPEIPDPRLASTYAEVVQALRSGASTSSDVRVELAALLQRLAQALRGDQGGSRSIPAVGSLVSTRV